MMRKLLSALTIIMVSLVVRADEAVDKFNFATGLLIRDEPELAADEFRELLQKFPQFEQADVAWFRLGEALRKANDNKAAITAFNKVVQDYPKSERTPQANYLLAGLLLNDQPKAAAAAYGAAAANAALAESALFGQAEALYRASDWPAAATAYQSLLQKFPDTKYAAQVVNGQGWAAFKRSDFTAAEQFFSHFLERYPTHDLATECRLKRADSRYHLKRYNEALADYETIIKIVDSPHRAAALSGKAWSLYDSGKVKESAVAFRTAAQAFKGQAQAGSLWFNAANAAFASDDFTTAVTDFTTCADCAAADLALSARYWQAASLVRLNRYAEANEVLVKLIAVDGLTPGLMVDSLMLRAEALLALKKPQESAAIYASVVRNHTTHPRAADAAAGEVLALEQSNNLPDATQAALTFGKNFPKHEQAGAIAFLVGEYYYRQRKFNEAAAAFSDFLKTYPKHEHTPDALYKGGWACWQTGKFDKAYPFFEQLATEFPTVTQAAEASFMAGRCADTNGDSAATWRAYERSVKLAPQSDAAMRATLEMVRLEHRDKKYPQALARVETFIKQFVTHATAKPHLSLAWLYKGEALLELDQPEAALTAYDEAAKGESEVAAAAKLGKAWALRKLARHAAAAALFAELATAGGTNGSEAQFWAARSYDDADNTAAAVAAYDAYLKQIPQGTQADEAAYRRLAVQARNKGYAAFEAEFAELVKNRPTSAYAAAALYDLAWSFTEQKKTTAAAQQFAELVKRFPTDRLAGDANFRIGEIAYEQGDMPAATAAYEAALATVDFKDKVLYKLGWALEHQKKHDEALAIYRRLIETGDDKELAAEARYREGRLLQTATQYEAAIAAYGQVPPGAFSERAAFGKAESLRLNNAATEAVAAYRQLLKDVTDPTVKMQSWLGLGHAYRTAGANKDAVEAYSEVVRLTETVEAAEAVMGQGYARLAMEEYDEAAKAFLKVDIIYGYDELKPEAVRMLVKVWEAAGDTAKADRYRKQLEKMAENSGEKNNP